MSEWVPSGQRHLGGLPFWSLPGQEHEIGGGPWEGVEDAVIVAQAPPPLQALGCLWSAIVRDTSLISAPSWSRVYSVAATHAEIFGLRLIDMTWDDDLLEEQA